MASPELLASSSVLPNSVRSSDKESIRATAALKAIMRSTAAGDWSASTLTVARRSKPSCQESSVVTTTATSTLGILGEIFFSPNMIAKANTPMKKVGQCV